MSTYSYVLPYFRDLIKEYPTWEQLSGFLTSSEGGKLQISIDNQYAIIRYDKTISNMTMPHVRWCRSVVWDTILNRPLSVAPPKAMAEEPYGWSIEETLNNYVYQEYLEGVNLNVFISAHEQGRPVHLATRTRIGASGTFYSKRPFTALLGDAMEAKGIARDIENLRMCLGPEMETAGSTAPIAQFASLILQHPEHRVVERVQTPNLYRLHYGYIAADGTVLIVEDKADIPALPAPVGVNTVMEWFTQISQTKTWEWQGLVVKDGHGNRWRLRSVIYRMIRSLRGATNRNDERFFTLRAKGLVETYLSYYPEDKEKYEKYERWTRSLASTLFDLYCKVHKEHSKKMTDIDRRYHIHLNTIQAAYISQPVNNGKRPALKKSDIIQYINTMPVPRILFLMNYDKNNRGAAKVHPAEDCEMAM